LQQPREFNRKTACVCVSSAFYHNREKNIIMSETAKLRFAGNTLTKEEQRQLLQTILPACQPQEGTPQNTFTPSELEELRRAIPSLQIGPLDAKKDEGNSNMIDICDLKQWAAPPTQDESMQASPQDGCTQTDQDDNVKCVSPEDDALDWYGVPRFHPQSHLSQAFRERVRSGEFTTPTNGVCPGFMQCNLVVLPQGQVAFDFLLFCQRNPKACPLINVCDVGSPYAPGVAPGADLRTDVPK
jgi:hypothetical protein